jgi:broad specificity phosphatase PhoE
MTTRVFLLRPGPDALTAEDRIVGSTDGAFSDNGPVQVRCLARRLADDDTAAD